MTETVKYERLLLTRVSLRSVTGSESIPAVPGKPVLDFWRWAHTEIFENVQGGVFAEFPVQQHSALLISSVRVDRL